MTTASVNPIDLDKVDETILNRLISDLGLNRNHTIPDPYCFICREERNYIHHQKHNTMMHSKTLKHSNTNVSRIGK